MKNCLVSPGCSSRLQNRILVFVDRTASPLSPYKILGICVADQPGTEMTHKNIKKFYDLKSRRVFFGSLGSLRGKNFITFSYQKNFIIIFRTVNFFNSCLKEKTESGSGPQHLTVSTYPVKYCKQTFQWYCNAGKTNS
jgi:hypothetical protein